MVVWAMQTEGIGPGRPECCGALSKTMTVLHKSGALASFDGATAGTYPGIPDCSVASASEPVVPQTSEYFIATKGWQHTCKHTAYSTPPFNAALRSSYHHIPKAL